MKHIFATALFAAASLMVPTGASAQNPLQATIPFDFTVGQSLLPAGTYRIAYVGRGLISLDSWTAHGKVFSPITPASDVRQNPHKLIFHKYGDQYFLSEIRGDLGESAAKVSTSKLEKRVRLQQEALTNQNNAVIALK